MIASIDIILVMAASVGGTLFAAVLGWLDSGETFNGRKFSSSVLRAVVAGVFIAVGFNFANEVTLLSLALAFLSGAGIDVLGNRISKAVKAGVTVQPVPAPPTPT